MTEPTALDAALPLLRCPVCTSRLTRDDRVVRCPVGHAFDVARHGYLNLAVGRAHHGTGDSASMVQARDHVLGTTFREVVDAVAQRVPRDAQVVVDAGGGTGRYLAAALDHAESARGVCLDLSVAALRRAARAHARAVAVGADIWRAWPVVDSCADVVLDVFAPRNATEFARVLAPHGVLITVTPRADHLVELREPLGLVSVDARKDERVGSTLSPFRLVASDEVHVRVRVERAEAVAIADMGPTARHVSHHELSTRAASLPEALDVTLAVTVQSRSPA